MPLTVEDVAKILVDWDKTKPVGVTNISRGCYAIRVFTPDVELLEIKAIVTDALKTLDLSPQGKEFYENAWTPQDIQALLI